LEVGLKITIDFASIKIRVYPMFEMDSMEFFYLKVCKPDNLIVCENETYKIKFGEIPIPGLENGKLLTFPTGKDSNGNERPMACTRVS
jgi:hypothetical protein